MRLYTNLSGIETQILREIGNLKKRKDRETVSGKIRSLDEDTLFSGKDGEEARRESELSAEERRLAAELFCRMADALLRLSVSALQSAETDTVVFAGGVSASQFLRRELDARLKKQGFRAVFGDPEMSSDNACGIARLGVAEYLRTHRKELDEKSKRMTK